MRKIQSTTRLCAAVALTIGGVWIQSSRALDVDMDPAPQIPLRAGDHQFFLVTLANAKAACEGNVSFKGLPQGLVAEPVEQAFKLAPGETRTLAFQIANKEWGAPAAVRPEVSVQGAEPVDFPARLQTMIVRERQLLDKQPLDNQGLLFYYSFGDGDPGHSNSRIFADKCVGESLLWNEGLWLADGGAKGKGSWCCNGDAESKVAFAPLNNVDHRRGTILFWVRKSTHVTEIKYNDPAKMSYDATWPIGPTIASGHAGEGLFGANYTPQMEAARTFKDWKFKKDSDSFISLRRYKALGDVRGYVEATYLGMRQRRYTVRAPFDWVREWHHVAVLWDTDNRRLEIYIDGQSASDKLRTNGKDEADPVWYPAPWNVGILGRNAQFGIILYPAEGGVTKTDRDEFYVYNRALRVEEIQANMKAAMGQAIPPYIEPEARAFHDTGAAEIKCLWAGPALRYTFDGSEPDGKSPPYEKPIVLRQSTTIKARSYMKGYAPSDVMEAKFESQGPDRTKPSVQDVLAFNDPRTILVVFDKKVDRSGAEAAGNYVLAGGPKVEVASLEADGQTVRLKTAEALESGKEYRITVRGVKDVSASANAMDALTGKPFRLRRLPDLAAWWSFDVVDGATVKDYGPNHIDGTAYRRLFFPGAVLVEGHHGKAIYLKEAGDYVDVSKYAATVESVNVDDMVVAKSTPFSVDAGSVFLWLKAKPGYVQTNAPAVALPAPAGSAASVPVASKTKKVLMHGRDVISKGYAYNLSIGGGTNLYISAPGTPSTRICPIADDTWHHVGLVFRNRVDQGSQVYVDGVLKRTLTLKFLPHTGTRLEICQPRNWGGSDAYLDGAIDDVMFFTRCLEAEEVRQLYTDGSIAAAPVQTADAPK